MDRAAFVETSRVNGHVVSLLVASCVFEFHVREVRGDVDGRVHEAERGGKDDVRTAESHLRDSALCVRAFWDVLLVNEVYRVAEVVNHFHSGVVVVLCPAAVIDRADVDKANFGFVLRASRKAECCSHCCASTSSKERSAFHIVFSQLDQRADSGG